MSRVSLFPSLIKRPKMAPADKHVIPDCRPARAATGDGQTLAWVLPPGGALTSCNALQISCGGDRLFVQRLS